ncbi:13312_t:CDS:2 [Ambispora gerdemannii]|uniref:13312_t:CDS:1 n=1 Tax=Ambispora gerdemannii TaxID=144530 RepID=A0A9N9BGT7_9GLOM|nr:13312_t:CDS:2 [Ambispora gerdemannii]
MRVDDMVAALQLVPSNSLNEQDLEAAESNKRKNYLDTPAPSGFSLIPPPFAFSSVGQITPTLNFFVLCSVPVRSSSVSCRLVLQSARALIAGGAIEGRWVVTCVYQDELGSSKLLSHYCSAATI